jgi:hypothetical protein
VFVLLGFAYVTMWEGLPSGPFDVWRAPSDLWGSWLAAVSLLHGHFRTEYATDPGAVLLLVPAAGPGHALGLNVGPDFTAYFAPNGWLLAGPYALAVSCLPLFAVDSLGRAWDLSPTRRMLLALSLVAVLFNPTILWGHPEGAVAVGLLLFAVDRARRRQWSRAGWLIGAAALAQPFALLGLPAVAVAAWTRGDDGVRDAWRVGWRAVVPYVLSLLPALIFAWGTTTRWLLHQPNWPSLNHRTPFTSLASQVPNQYGAVTSGPGRMVALAMAVVLAVILVRRRPDDERVVLWSIATSFFVWVGVESVIDSYYVWPALALGLLLAARGGSARFGAAMALAVFTTVVANVHLHGMWPWWTAVMVPSAALLVLTWPDRATAPREERQRTRRGPLARIPVSASP